MDSRPYEKKTQNYDYLAQWGCVLVKWNAALWNVLVNPDPNNANIFFEKEKLQEFCRGVCKKTDICIDKTKEEILNMIW